VIPVHFTERRADGSLKSRKTAGEVLCEVLDGLPPQAEYVCIVAPNERLFSDHLSALLRTLQDSGDAGSAWSDMLLTRRSGDGEHADLNEDPDAGCPADAPPIGYGRFLFRLSALHPHLRTALPYLDAFAMHLLFGTGKSVPSRRCTLESSGPHGAGETAALVPAGLEREILIDFSPEVFRTKAPAASHEPQHQPPASQLLAAMTPEEKTKLAVELAHAIPLPPMAKNLAFGVYRLWLRFHELLGRPGARNGGKPVD
jgi:hypothetical protein